MIGHRIDVFEKITIYLYAWRGPAAMANPPYFDVRALIKRRDAMQYWGMTLNNRVFLSKNYGRIVAPRKFDVFETKLCSRREASRANVLVLRTLNFQGATIRTIVPRYEHMLIVYY